MKKQYLLLFLTVFLLLSACSGSQIRRTDLLYEGMSYDEYRTVVPEEERESYGSYEFFTSSDGKNVVVKLTSLVSETGEWLKYDSVESITVLEPADLTETAFSKLKEGMTLAEMVALIGIPDRFGTNLSVESLEYWGENGRGYHVFLTSMSLETGGYELVVSGTKVYDS